MFFNCFFNIHKNAFYTNSRFLSQKNACNKKKEIFDSKVLKLQRFSKDFPNVGENALFWQDHLSKNLLKPNG